MDPRDIEVLVKDEQTFRTYVVTTLQQLSSETKASEDRLDAIDGQHGSISKLNTRVSRVERKFWIASGALSIIVFVFKFLIGVH